MFYKSLQIIVIFGYNNRIICVNCMVICLSSMLYPLSFRTFLIISIMMISKRRDVSDCSIPFGTDINSLRSSFNFDWICFVLLMFYMVFMRPYEINLLYTKCIKSVIWTLSKAFSIYASLLYLMSFSVICRITKTSCVQNLANVNLWWLYC